MESGKACAMESGKACAMGTRLEGPQSVNMQGIIMNMKIVWSFV